MAMAMAMAMAMGSEPISEGVALDQPASAQESSQKKNGYGRG